MPPSGEVTQLKKKIFYFIFFFKPALVSSFENKNENNCQFISQYANEKCH
jgi:hypothetical protein